MAFLNTNVNGNPQFGQQPYQVAQVAAPPTPDAYASALQQSFAPYFGESQQQLAGDLAGMGILSSGAGAKQLQDLTARNNATYANALLPLIQQGFGQQFQANAQNAGAQNQAASQGYSGALQSFLNQLQNQFAAQRQNQDLQAQYGLAQMGYGNQDYLTQLGILAGLQGQGLGGLNSIYGQGMNNAYNGYLSPQSNMAQYAYGAGGAGVYPNSGYGGSSSSGIPSWSPTSSSFTSTSSYDPYGTGVNMSQLNLPSGGGGGGGYNLGGSTPNSLTPNTGLSDVSLGGS